VLFELEVKLTLDHGGLMPSVRCDKAAQRQGYPGICWRLEQSATPFIVPALAKKGLEISQTRMQSPSVAHVLDL
jgi:hypothetical protein